MRPEIDRIQRITLKYAEGRTVAAGKGIFICHLGDSPLRYLHKLFVPDASAIRRLEHVLWSPLPQDYMELLRLYNGATLFDNSLFLYGVDGNYSRSVALQDQTALSIFDEIEDMKMKGLDPAKSGIAPIGSVAAADEVFFIELKRDGRTFISRESGESRMFDSTVSCLAKLVGLIDNISDHSGLCDPSKEQLEREMIAFLSMQ